MSYDSGLNSTATLDDPWYNKNLREPWIDPHTPVFNEQKHRETCAKNRKKRKAKRK